MLQNKAYAGSGLPQGPFLGNNLFPLKVGLRWVFVNGPKWVQEWVLGSKSGSKCVKTHFCTHFKPILAYSRKPTFTQFKGVGNCFPKRALRQSRPSIKQGKIDTYLTLSLLPCLWGQGFQEDSPDALRAPHLSPLLRRSHFVGADF